MQSKVAIIVNVLVEDLAAAIDNDAKFNALEKDLTTYVSNKLRSHMNAYRHGRYGKVDL